MERSGIFLKIRENHESWTSYRRLGGPPLLNPNRGRACPISGIASSPPPEALNFSLNLGNPQPRLDGENGAILETRQLPRISLKSGENVGRSIAAWMDSIFNP